MMRAEEELRGDEQHPQGDDQRAQGRPRGMSDAARRDERERQRAEQRQSRLRASLATNRFLKRKESMAEPRPEEDEEEAEQKEDVAPPKGQLLMAAGKKLSDQAMREEKAGEQRAILTPSVHALPSLVLHRSRWTRELDDDAACGLYVDDERRELRQVASSTLVRLEERLRREMAMGGSDGGAIRLNDLLHVPQRVEYQQLHATNTACDAERHRHPRQVPPVAALEIAIDRIMLDDHVSFSLADRLEVQMRSLCASYTQLLQAQPWQGPEQRVQAFMEASLASNETTADRSWATRTQHDVQAMVQGLGDLQQLHYQLLTKWSELQDCYRQPAIQAHSTRLRLSQHPRAESISLTTTRAFLELPGGGNATEKLLKRLDELEIKDQHLHVVLTLEGATVEAPRTPEANPSLFQPSSWACLSCRPRWTTQLPPPKLYVALFINGREVGRTRAATWASSHSKLSNIGVILLRETLRTQLHFFPDAVAVKVFEQGLLFDTLLSTTAIPLLVPGHDLTASRDSHVAAASLAPSREWYQFSSVRAMQRTHWHPSFLNAAAFAMFQRHTHGRVRVQVAWVASAEDQNRSDADDEDNQTDNDGRSELIGSAVLPPRRLRVAASHDAKLVGPRVIPNRRFQQLDDTEVFGRKHINMTTFSYERDFLVHVTDNEDASTAVDRNDPLNVSIVRLQDHARAQSALLRERDVFRASALAYDCELLGAPGWGGRRSRLTRRNYLLQLRDREHVAKYGTSFIVPPSDFGRGESLKKWDHVAFEAPLPLNDDEISANKDFLSLLRPEIPAFDRHQRLEDALAAGERSAVEKQRKLQLLKIQDFVERVLASSLVLTAKSSSTSRAVQRERTKSLAMIIQEQPLPLLPGAFDLSGLSGLFARRRRLRPRVEKRAAPATMADWPRHCTLYVQIKAATNVPVRVQRKPSSSKPVPKREKKSGGRRGNATEDEDDNDNNQNAGLQLDEASAAHVFVEMRFQGRRRRTTSTHVRATGAVWMETLVVPFYAPLDDWTPESIARSQDVIRLNLFDQLVRSSSDSGPSGDAHALASNQTSERGGDGAQSEKRTQSFHQENRYLGSLEIPFTTLYHNHGTLDATLRCEMPVVNVGYTNAKHSSSNWNDLQEEAGNRAAIGVGADNDEDGVVQSTREATFLSVMMTLDPLLALPVKPFEENAAGNSEDDAALAAYAQQWAKSTQQLNASTKHRDFHAFVKNLSHGQTFLTRYITPEAPPARLDGSSTRDRQCSVPQVVRFVHLIPYLDDWHMFPEGGELDIWTTSQELLELNAGDFEEHAVLLCNYFLWIDRHEANRRSYLVLASGVPEGKTVYVLRQDTYETARRSVLWNASTGIGYSVLDDRCPVLDIWLVVSSENMYANIQPKKRLTEMTWDIETNSKAWKPFFTSAFKKDQFPLSTVQARNLTYAETPSEYVQQVEIELREALKLEIRRWRSTRYTTTFNMDLSLKLRGQLERLERQMQNVTDGTRDEKDAIAELLEIRRVSGMPLNMTFTDIDTVIGRVKSTNIYWNDHDEVEFGLGVYVHAYPNCILSVWVYLVAVEPLE